MPPAPVEHEDADQAGPSGSDSAEEDHFEHQAASSGNNTASAPAVSSDQAGIGGSDSSDEDCYHPNQALPNVTNSEHAELSNCDDMSPQDTIKKEEKPKGRFARMRRFFKPIDGHRFL